MTSNHGQVVHVGPLGTLVIKLTFGRTRGSNASECFVLMTPTGTYLEGKHDTDMDAIGDMEQREKSWMMAGGAAGGLVHEVVGAGRLGTRIIKTTMASGSSSGQGQFVYRLMSVSGEFLPGEHNELEITQTALDEYERSLLNVLPPLASSAVAPEVIETGLFGTKIVKLSRRPEENGGTAFTELFVLVSASNEYLEGSHLSLEEARGAKDQVERSLIEQGMEKFKPVRRPTYRG